MAKKFYNILLLFIIIITSMLSVNAVVVLNECGMSSGWVEGETYLINITEIPTTYTTNWCFILPAGTNTNLNFVQISDKLVVNKQITTAWTLNRFEFFSVVQNSLNTGHSFSNFNIEVPYFDFKTQTESRQFAFIDAQHNIPSGSSLEYSTFNNITIIGVNIVFGGYDSNAGFSFSHNTLSDLYIYGQSLYSGNLADSYDNNTFEDSVLILDDVIAHPFVDNVLYTLLSNSDFNNVIMISPSNSVVNNEPAGTNTATASIIEGLIHTDSDNDGEADSEIESYTIGSLIEKTVLGINYIQDFEEGGVLVSAGQTVVNINDEVIGSPITFQTQSNNIIDTSFTTLLFSNFNGIILNDGARYEHITGFFDILLQDNIASVFTSATQEKGLIRISGNDIVISDLNFNKISDNNNAHMISDLTGISRNNITISGNNFYKADDNFKFLNNYMLRLTGNNININSNSFDMFTVENSGYEVLDIDGSNPRSNDVYLNNFTLDATISTTPTVIFSDNHDTDFYNNYLDSNVVISSETDTTGLNATPLIPFLHTDDKIYYFYIGNYYIDNTGCVDGNGDGFCDSSYTSGTIVDDRPLSVYPFDYTSHLLSADIVIDSLLFNITLYNITNNETYTIDDISSILEIGFSQDSDFQDLSCDYIIDGIVVSGATETSVEKNIIYSIPANGFEEREYLYRVECYNDVTYVISEEINFFVIYETAVPPEDNNTTSTTGGIIISEDVGLDDIFEGTPTEVTDNVNGLFKLMSTPYGWLLIIGFIMLGLSILGLIIAIPFAMIGGKR